MPMLTLSNDQVVELVKQLPQEQKTEIFRFLLISQWQQWQDLSNYGADKVRLAGKERGYDWEKMTEDEKEDFIDAVGHEKL
jgi:Mg/Co/Ni transporter MgtE